MSQNMMFIGIGAVCILLILLGVLQGMTQRQKDAEALTEAERVFANDPAGLLLWKQQREAMRRADRNARATQAAIQRNTFAAQQAAQQAQQQAWFQQQQIQQQLNQQQINNNLNNPPF